ncbi:hypothetical protein WN990_36970 [Kitasatospora purpeofusca]|uniref:hypothetical protein n=1 Tax=Kitasatospora purpeofusca TaxID=67352 RepID=UPI0030EFD8FB
MLVAVLVGLLAAAAVVIVAQANSEPATKAVRDAAVAATTLGLLLIGAFRSNRSKGTE